MTMENTLIERRSKKALVPLETAMPAIAHSAVTNPSHFRPVKLQITLRVDADVIAWFRENHPRYQTLMNAVLRKEMTQAIAEERREQLERSNKPY